MEKKLVQIYAAIELRQFEKLHELKRRDGVAISVRIRQGVDLVLAEHGLAGKKGK